MSENPEPVYCKCGRLIGHKKYGVTTAVWLTLADNPIVVLSIDGVCRCGREFHWKQSNEFYYRLMRHYPRWSGVAT